MTEEHTHGPDRIKVYKDEAGEWRWRRRDGGNNEITAASSEGYERRGGAIENIYETQGGTYIILDPDEEG